MQRAVGARAFILAVNFTIASFTRFWTDINEIGIAIIGYWRWWNTQSSSFLFLLLFGLNFIFLPFILSCVYLASAANFIAFQFVLFGWNRSKKKRKERKKNAHHVPMLKSHRPAFLAHSHSANNALTHSTHIHLNTNQQNSAHRTFPFCVFFSPSLAINLNCNKKFAIKCCCFFNVRSLCAPVQNNNNNYHWL